MRVIICKLYSETYFERNVQKIVSREKKRADSKLKVFSVSEPIQQKLEQAGIPCEILDDFNRFVGAADEPSWDTVFELSDELRSSINNISSLKFSGINFLTMEYSLIKYVYAVKLSNLLKQMAAQNVDAVIIVLTAPHTTWLADFNTKAIKTVKYGRTIKSLVRTGLFSDILVEGYSALNNARDFFSKPFNKGQAPAVPEEARKLPKALFLVSYATYTRPAMAIIDACRENGLIPYIATDDRSILPLIKGHHAAYRVKPPISLSLFTAPRHLGKYLNLPSRLKKYIKSFYHENHRPEAVKDELSAAYLCRLTLLDELPRICCMAISRIIFLEKLIKETSPDILCIMPQDRFLQQTGSALMKQKYRRPVLACSAAWEIDDASSFRRHFHADKLAVLGENIKDIYTGSGIAPERIAVTGAAHFDRLFNRDRDSDDKILSEHGIDPHGRIVIFAASPPSTLREKEDMLSGIISATRQAEDIQLVVKTHPNEDITPYRIITGKYNDPKIHVFKDIDLYALISRCELLITRHSTVALEAMMVDKPVVTINISGQQDAVPYAREGAAIGVYSKDDIQPAILKALYDEETRAKMKAGRDRFVRRWAGEPDGRASQRIVNLMKEMIVYSRQAAREAM